MLERLKQGYWKVRSLYVLRFLLSFLLIIALMLTMFFTNDAVLKHSFREQLTRQNLGELANKSDKLENTWRLLAHGTINYLFSNPNFTELNANSFNFRRADLLSKDLISYMSGTLNPHIKNTMIWFDQYPYLIDQTGVVDKQLKFSNLAVNDTYTQSYWEQSLKQRDMMVFHPQGQFRVVIGNEVQRMDNLLPVTIRNSLYPNVFIIVFIDIDSLMKELDFPDSSSLLASDNTIVWSSLAGDFDVAQVRLPQGYSKHDDYYYFYNQGAFTKLTYVTQVPDFIFSSSLRKLNLFSLGVLALTLLLAVAFSFFLSARLYKPIKKLVNVAMKTNRPEGERRTHELELITKHFLETIQANQDQALHIKEQSSLLETFYYKDRLKNIRGGKKEEAILDTPFRLLIFKVFFHDRFAEQFGTDYRNAVYCYTAFVRHSLSLSYPNQQTFQMENDIIVGLIFTHESTNEVLNALSELKTILDNDQQYSYFSILIGASYEHYSRLLEAYEDALALLSLRSPNAETQFLIQEQMKNDTWDIPIHKEKELINYMIARKFREVREWLESVWNSLESSNASQSHYEKFISFFIKQLLKSFDKTDGDFLMTDEVTKLQKNMKSTQDYHRCLELLLSNAERLVAERRQDPVIQFVQEAIRQHYASDISLQFAADKLNMSSSYLSAYIKSKTGTNFQDMLSEWRIEKAKELLLQSDASMQDIASQIGYFSTNSFYRMFKKCTGITPGEYKRNQLLK